jgi:hypothetical protein
MTLTGNTNLPAITGFSIENSEPRVVLNVQDKDGNHLVGANVTVTCGSTTVNLVTVASGCIEFVAKRGERCSVTVSMVDFSTYSGEFYVVTEVQLTDPNNNSPIRIEDGSQNPVAGASVSINSVNVATTPANGVVELDMDESITNTLDITASGFQNYSKSYNVFLPFVCADPQYRVVAIVAMSV